MVPPAVSQKPLIVAYASGSEPRIIPKPSPIASLSTYHRWKGFTDRPLAAVTLIVFGPVIGLLWLLVKWSSPGPGFYRQERVGRNGKPFYMIKLRSMRQDAEAASGAVWSPVHDPRVTRLGQALRKYHLDELPQLFNVLKGEMSLVGPRPERPQFVEVLSSKIDGYRSRLLVLPGITGLAQLNLPPDTDLNSVARKLVLDLEYIEGAGPWLEARLLICTATRLLKIPSMGLLRLRRHVTLPDGAHNGSATISTADTVPVAAVAEQTVHHRSSSNGHAKPRPMQRRPR
jgi:lipopolysaccharide/colanic/teichoic acid biosynthesis glycosyltransferase